MGSSPETQLRSTHRKNQAMKFFYATLAGSAMAAMPLWDFLEDQVNSVFTENNDGFDIDLSPYFLLNVADDGLSGKLSYSLDGENMNVDNWEVSLEGGRFWGEAYGGNAQELGVPVGDIVESINYDENCKWSASAQGLELDCDRAAELNFRNGVKGNIKEDFALELNVVQNGAAVSVDIDVDGQRTANGVSQLEDYNVWFLMRPYTLSLETQIKIKDFKKCEIADIGCSISVDNSLVADNFKSDATLSFDMKKFAAIFKPSGSDVDSQLLFIRKVGKDGKGLPLSNNKGWMSIHLADGANWQKAVRSKKDSLVLRFPTYNQWEQDAYPQLLALAEPFIDFSEAVMLNIEKLPYLFYYLDDFLATFSNEFDCSKYVAATNVESDYLADYFEVDTFNGFMKENCQALNEWIVEAIQCEELDAGMSDMRDYVSAMNSPSGQAEFNSLFGSIF